MPVPLRRIASFSAGGALFALVTTFGYLGRLVEYQRIASPDGGFYAVATYRAWRSLVPMMPGSSGDKPGYATVYTRAGQACGRAPVEMVSMLGEIEWQSTRAELPLVAEWNLATRTVRIELR